MSSQAVRFLLGPLLWTATCLLCCWKFFDWVVTTTIILPSLNQRGNFASILALCLNFQNFYLPRSKQDESCYPHLSLAHVREVVTTFVFGSCYSFLDSFLVDSLDKVNTFILPLCLLSMVHIPYDLLCIQYKSFNLVNYTLIKDIGSNMSRAMLLFQFSIKIT